MLRIEPIAKTEQFYQLRHSYASRMSRQVSENFLGWFGTWSVSVKDLNLTNLDQDQFQTLSQGPAYTPTTTLNTDFKENRIQAIDFVFTAPKSVSLLSSMVMSYDFDNAIIQAALETMTEIENEIQCRIIHEGIAMNKMTRNMLYASFLNRNSSLLEGYCDPTISIHCLAMNYTYDQEEQKWKQLEYQDKVENLRYYKSYFHSILAMKLVKMGIPVKKAEDSFGATFEIAGVSDELIQKFSRRTNLINKIAKEKGITQPKKVTKIAKITRNQDSIEMSQSQLKNIYMSLMTEEELALFERLIKILPE